MGQLTSEEFEPALLRLIETWLAEDKPTAVIACGMVGAKQGWIEAPYAATPCQPQSRFTAAPTRDPRLDVQIIAGVSQSEPADVMRGEETQIAGFQRLNPKWDGVICLPGTHTKWVQMSAGEIVSFQTFMTGEIFALLSTSSVLRHSVSGETWEDDAFLTAVDEAMSRPEALAARLFGIRAQDLLHHLPPASARARLSGLLVGAELAAAKPYWIGQSIAMIGAQELCDGYAAALVAQHVPVTRTDASQMTLAGLKAAYATWKEPQ
jgi:2-dehydro-3-deoxygalactonokinase